MPKKKGNKFYRKLGKHSKPSRRQDWGFNPNSTESFPSKGPKGTKGNKLNGQRKGNWSGDLRFQPVVFVPAAIDTPESQEKQVKTDQASQPLDDSSSDSELSDLAECSPDPSGDLDVSMEVPPISHTDLDNEINMWVSEEMGLPRSEEIENSEQIGDESVAESSQSKGPDSTLDTVTNDTTEPFTLEEAGSDVEVDYGDGYAFSTQEPSEDQVERMESDEYSEGLSDDNDMDEMIDETIAGASSETSDASGDEYNDISADFMPLEVTLDGDEFSNDDDDVIQDYLDNMSDLDDDQIFALANQSVHAHEDYDAMDDIVLDAHDDYFDQLIKSGVDPKYGDKNKISLHQRRKHDQKQVSRAAKAGFLQPLWMKYPDFISVKDVVAELTMFIKVRPSKCETLRFPPLDTNANWYIQQFANHFDMSSKVSGKNEHKTVVVSLTKGSFARPLAGKVGSLLHRRQTLARKDVGQLSEKLKIAMQQTALELSQSKFYNIDKGRLTQMVQEKIISADLQGQSGAAVKVMRATAKDRTNATSGRIRDGHIVGQHATAIEDTNFGHQLMRQMGWTEGSGLGRERAGIVKPLPAVVKLTRGGLGG